MCLRAYHEKHCTASQTDRQTDNIMMPTANHTKGNVDHAQQERRWGAHLPRPQVDKPLKSVRHGQCDARPAVTFPATEHHRSLAGTKLQCLVTEAHGCQQLVQSCCLTVCRLGVEPVTSRSPVRHTNHYTEIILVSLKKTCWVDVKEDMKFFPVQKGQTMQKENLGTVGSPRFTWQTDVKMMCVGVIIIVLLL